MKMMITIPINEVRVKKQRNSDLGSEFQNCEKSKRRASGPIYRKGPGAQSHQPVRTAQNGL